MSSDFIMDQKLANWRDLRQAAGLSGLSPQAGSYLRDFGTNLRGAFAPARRTKFGAPLWVSAIGGKADIAATPLRKPLIAGARRQPLAQSCSGVCSTLRTRRPKRRSRNLSAARKVRMPPLSCSVCDVRAALGAGVRELGRAKFRTRRHDQISTSACRRSLP